MKCPWMKRLWIDEMTGLETSLDKLTMTGGNVIRKNDFG